MTRGAYYNENDPYAAQWLRNLIAAGEIPDGKVDDRSIVDVRADDLLGYDECHFFAGIGGWPLALALAGWRGPVWTGSCPCQPLSSAGQRKGHADERHLWPAFYRLIAERRPATVFGEQVAGRDGFEWLAGVRADLESAGYAIGAADLCAAGAGAPHIRQRLFWVADSDRRMEIPESNGRHGPLQPISRQEISRPVAIGARPGSDGSHSGLAYRDAQRLQKRALSGGERQAIPDAAGSGAGFWSHAVWLACLDGKSRRVEPGIQPLAHGVPGRVGRLRAYGNAIVPQAAAAFVTAFMDTRG